MILFGSSAIKYWFSDFKREPKDEDYIVKDKSLYKSNRNIEYHELPTIFNNYDSCILKPDDLATLKASHLCWDINWRKHMFDLQFLLDKGCRIKPKLFFDLYNFWNVYHTKNKRSDLTMPKEEFFKNAINYDVLEHDKTHLILNPVPIYTLVLKDGKDVELDENKFHNLTYNQKIMFVQEECMVMAWERYRNYDLHYKSMYDKMLTKFIMKHCPLFALIFTLENYKEILKINKNFIKIINDECERIKPVSI